jgi:hypothetical protein
MEKPKYPQKLPSEGVQLVVYGAISWSALYIALGIYWWSGGPGFPFGSNSDPGASISLFSQATADNGAPIIVIIGALSLLAGSAILASWRPKAVIRYGILAFIGLLTAALLLVVPDYRALVAVGYAPIFLVGLPFGWPDANFADAIPWVVLNQLLCIAGGLFWGATTLIYYRRDRKACVHCGRSAARTSQWTSPQNAKRWGRWAVVVACFIPVIYATTRWAWALGIPFGIPDDFLREGQANGMWWAGAALATLGVGGAILTLGLIQKWGEIFPRWIPYLRGKRVPLAAAIIPATFVSVLITSAGLMFVRLVLNGSFPFLSVGWGTVAPELLWPIWGLALGVATLAYYYRRRGKCQYCGRGSKPSAV